MYDLSFLSLPVVLILNLYIFLWLFLAVIYLTRKSHFTHPSSQKQQKHFVSVIVPSRNEETVIDNLILDLKDQTYRNMEIIVVCHNCTDKTFEKASQAAENSPIPVKVYKLNTEETGKALALRYGLSHSHGQLIAYFDADNHIEKNTIEKMVECIESGFDGVQAKITSKNPNINKLTLLQHIEFLIYGPIFCGGKHRVGLNAGIGGTGVMIKRNALEKVGGFRNVLIEDFDLHLRLTMKGFRIGYAEHISVYDEKVTQWRFLIKQRARWIAGYFQLLRLHFKDQFNLLRRDPIAFIYLYNPLCTLGLLGSFMLTIAKLVFPQLTYISTPLLVWIPEMIFLNLLFTLILHRQKFSVTKSLFYPYLLFIFSLHWFIALAKAPFIKGWSDTKTPHGT